MLQQTRKFSFERVHWQMDEFFCALIDNIGEEDGELSKRSYECGREKGSPASLPAVYELPESELKLINLAMRVYRSWRSSSRSSRIFESKAKAAKHFLNSLFEEAPSTFVQRFVLHLIEADFSS